MYLYFEHSNGDLSFICECSKEEVDKKITEFVHSINPNYKIPYMRSWGSEDNFITYDIGSHTEFFHLVKDRRFEN